MFPAEFDDRRVEAILEREPTPELTAISAFSIMAAKDRPGLAII
jgi:hypothetical protein